MDFSYHSPEDITLFKKQALQWASSFDTACYFDSNAYQDKYSSFDVLIAAGARYELKTSETGAFEALEKFREEHKTWLPGFLSYDLKNQIENLSSSNIDNLHFPDLYFFVPEHLILIKDGKVQLYSATAELIIKEIEGERLPKEEISFRGTIKSRFSKEEYLRTVRQLQSHIHRGDIYEVNFCQEFYSEKVHLNPTTAFQALNSISPTPFANFFKHRNTYIISATPERFLRKEGSKLISQPIKGTVKRGANQDDDLRQKNALRNNIKEQSENVMIVDLVRNDLTRCSVPGSVEVEELFGIYSFRQVHQMISTVISKANPALSNAEIMKAVFPMGSMTGAPKIRAMQLIEEYERTKRGVFSGAVGYFSPENDFDFNVVIRSILYNDKTKYLSFQVGSAITFASDPEKEYEECLVKAEAILKVLS